MAIIKKSRLREMSDAELESKRFELQKELNSERGLVAAGGRASNPGKISELKRSIARILTILHERKLGMQRTQPKISAEEAKATKATNVSGSSQGGR